MQKRNMFATWPSRFSEGFQSLSMLFRDLSHGTQPVKVPTRRLQSAAINMASICASLRPVAGPRGVAIGSRQSAFMAPAPQKALAGEAGEVARSFPYHWALSGAAWPV